MRILMTLALTLAPCCALSTAAAAQRAAQPPASLREVIVPAHTELVVRLDEEIASSRARIGQLVPVSVARDVIVDGAVLIPRGTAGYGAVTARTGKGAFGKSGKIDIELRTVEVGGRAVPIVGRYHASGRGRTGETIGTILAGGVVAGAFVTGEHAVFEQGREFTAFTADATRIARPTVRLAQTVIVSDMPWPRFAAGGQAPRAVQLTDAAAVGTPIVSSYASLVRFQQGLAEAQPIRGGDPRQGWTISD